MENVHLIPDVWKKDAAGNTRYIFFWAVGFSGSSGNLYVRCLYWSDGRWCVDCYYLVSRWSSSVPSAILAS
ncbi:hypothetical protein HY734_03100 [Candidatus Uhrbacteria bacterium]|nr:hypothetical protein [Candidatus Uhrbacteria bacterium]